MFDALKGWSRVQKHVVAAAYLGWTLDAFDFFLLIFVIKDVAHEFGAGKSDIAWATALTLAMRPLGAFIFGRLADRFGRRPVLMADVALYSLFGFATAFSPNLIVFLVDPRSVRRGDGRRVGHRRFADDGDDATGSARLVSGVLQSGYPSGYLLASVVFGLLYDHARLARHVHGGHRAGAAHSLHPQQRAGIAGLQSPRARQTGTVLTCWQSIGSWRCMRSC